MLMYAVSIDHREVTGDTIRFLLGQGVDVNDQRTEDPERCGDIEYWTALHWACWSCNLSAVQLLLENGAKADGRHPQSRPLGGKQYETPLQWIARHLYGDSSRLKTQLEIVETLLQAGANSQVRDDKGTTLSNAGMIRS